MLFESFATKLNRNPVGPPGGYTEDWLVNPWLSIEDVFDRVEATMKIDGYSYDYAERTDMYFRKSGIRVDISVRTLRGDALEDLRNRHPDKEIDEREAIVIEFFECPD